MSSTSRRSGTVDGFRIVTIWGLRIRVHIRPGSSNRPPLVLCNGIGAGLEALEPLVRELPPDLEVVRFDVPGTGSSSPPPFPYRLPMMAALLAQVLTKLGYDRVDLLGVSWGGALAQQFAVRHPRRCRRLVLVSTITVIATPAYRPDLMARMLTPRRHREPAYAAEVAGDLYGGTMRGDPMLAGQILGRQARAGSGLGYAYQLGAVLGWSSLPWLPAIRQRTLLLFGDDDPVVPVLNGRLMRSLMPRARLHVYEGGHLELVARPDEFAPLIDDFLRAPDTRTRARAKRQEPVSPSAG